MHQIWIHYKSPQFILKLENICHVTLCRIGNDKFVFFHWIFWHSHCNHWNPIMLIYRKKKITPRKIHILLCLNETYFGIIILYICGICEWTTQFEWSQAMYWTYKNCGLTGYYYIMPWSHLCVKPPRMSNVRQM